MLTRGEPQVAIPGDATRYTLLGRVTAPAGLVRLVVNGRPEQPGPGGRFSSRIQVKGEKTPVAITAVDQAAREARLSFMLARYTPPATRNQLASAGKPAPARPAAELDSIDFGRYYALIIGNAH